MAATIDIRMTNLQKMQQDKFERMLEIVEEEVSKAFPQAIVRVRKSQSMSDIVAFGLGKDGKQKVVEFMEQLFDEGTVFSELNDEYY